MLMRGYGKTLDGGTQRLDRFAVMASRYAFPALRLIRTYVYLCRIAGTEYRSVLHRAIKDAIKEAMVGDGRRGHTVAGGAG